jgi:hypothetical protein
LRPKRSSPRIEGGPRDRQLRYFFEEYAFDTDLRELHRGATHLAAALALFGRVAEARAAVNDGLALDPHFTCHRFLADPLSDNPIFVAAERRISGGMRLAGVPDR